MRNPASFVPLLLALAASAPALAQDELPEEQGTEAPAPEQPSAEASPEPTSGEPEAAPEPEPEPEPPPPKDPQVVDAQVENRPGEWSGNAGAGFLATDGNAQSRSMNGKLQVDYTRKRWKNSFQASAVNTSSSAGGTSAERYLATNKVDYQFFAHNYAFVVGEYEKDLFGATRERISEAVGLGRHVLAGPKHFLDLEGGVGLRQVEDQATRMQTEEAITRASTKYEWKFTEKNSFSENAKVESGTTNTFSESVTALKLAIVGNLSASLSVTLRHNSDVPPDRENLDTESAINLVYDFGKK